MMMRATATFTLHRRIDLTDPATFVTREVTTFLDIFEHLVLALLELADTLVKWVRALIKAVLEAFGALLDMPIGEGTFLDTVYRWIQERAGIAACAGAPLRGE